MRYAPTRLVVLTALLALAIIAVPALLSGPVYADPGSGGGPTTTSSETTSPPTRTPDGDAIAAQAHQPVSVVVLAPTKVSTAAFTARIRAKRVKQLRKAYTFYTETELKWNELMGVPTHISRQLATSGLQSLRRLVLWQREQAWHARDKAHHPPHLADWLCIHHYEGAWNDHGGPYWGGLQMNQAFMQTYGGWLYSTKGTADHWTPLEQIWVAEKAFKTRGFGPWPNTAADCGLL